VFAASPRKVKGWRHWVNLVTMRGDWKREG
jgi:hypothetical protein